MGSGFRRGSRGCRPRAERMEGRLVMSGNPVASEVRAILNSSPGATTVRPNTPVLPFESAYAAATFIDPSVRITAGGRISVDRRDYVAPEATLDAAGGYIKIRSTSTIQDNATLDANPSHAPGATGIFIGDNVVVGTGATIIGPASIGGLTRATGTAAAPASIGANAVVDGAIIRPGAFVGALARVGPGVTLPTGFRVLPGMDVTTNAQADTPALGKVVAVTSADPSAATARSVLSATEMLASGYSELYQGQNATGGAASAGPVPSAVAAAGSTIYFGSLLNVSGASGEPTSKYVNFEAAAGTPTFLTAAGTFAALPANRSFAFPDRIIGAVKVDNPGTPAAAASYLAGSDSIRADEAPFITFGGPIRSIGTHVSIHSPLGKVQTATTTTVVTTITPAAGTPTTTTTATTVLTPGPATATAGTTTATTTGTNAAGVATTGTISTSIATVTTNLGGINIGSGFTAEDGATILGGPAGTTAIGDDVTVGAGAVVDTSILGSGVTVGAGAYVLSSDVAAGTAIPAGEILINNKVAGTVEP